MRRVPVGTIVQFEARNTRGQETEGDIIPAIVLRQWDDGSLALFAFHFAGTNYVHTIRVEEVEILTEPNVRGSNTLLQKFAMK
jgi:hypothetical protein